MSKKLKEFGSKEGIIFTNRIGQLRLQKQCNADIVIVENNNKVKFENKTRFKIHKNRYGRKAYLLTKKELVYILSSYVKASNK